MLVVAGLVIGQTQGPLKDPGNTVSRPRKAPDATGNNAPEEVTG